MYILLSLKVSSKFRNGYCTKSLVLIGFLTKYVISNTIGLKIKFEYTLNWSCEARKEYVVMVSLKINNLTALSLYPFLWLDIWRIVERL